MRPPPSTVLVARIHGEIERFGQSIVTCDALLDLVSPTEPIQAQFSHIFATAEREHWSFEFRNDGTVRFSKLNASDEGLILQWPGEDAPSSEAAQS